MKLKKIALTTLVIVLASSLCWGAATNFVDGSTVVTADFLNSIFKTSGGHVHDGTDADGHAPKIILTGAANVTGTLPWANVGGVAGTDYVAPSTLVAGQPLTGDVTVYGHNLVLTAGSAVNDVSTSAHGFCPTAPNDINKYLDGTGHWSSLSAAVSGVSSFNGRTGAVTKVFSDYSGFYVPTVANGGPTIGSGAATYYVKTADASLPNAVPFSTYSSGFIKNTTGTGAISIAQKGDADLILPAQAGMSGRVLTTNGSTTAWTAVAGTGTVTSVSVVSANGLAGTVATASTTPAITLTTSVTGVLKGNGTAISAATPGTDYLVTATDAALSTSDITTNNASASKHGFLPKLPNDATKFLTGTGTYTAPSLSALTNNLSADVTMSSANTFYTGPSVTLSAGTWLLTGQVHAQNSNASQKAFTAKLWDGTTVAVSSSSNIGSGGFTSFPLSGVIVIASGSPVWKIALASTGTGGTISAAVDNNSPGNNASTITAIKIAP